MSEKANSHVILWLRLHLSELYKIESYYAMKPEYGGYRGHDWKKYLFRVDRKIEQVNRRLALG